MINKLPPYSALKTHQLATWAREFMHKPKPILVSIAFNPTWKVTNLNERAVAVEALFHRNLLDEKDISSLMDFLLDDENFPIVVSKDEISEIDIPEGLDKSGFENPLEFTRCEFQRTNARLRVRTAEIIAEHILQNGEVGILADFNRTTLSIIENMMGEPYFLPTNDRERPDQHFIDFIKVLYLTGTESASKIMQAIGINENDLGLTLNQKRLMKNSIMRDYSI